MTVTVVWMTTVVVTTDTSQPQVPCRTDWLLRLSLLSDVGTAATPRPDDLIRLPSDTEPALELGARVGVSFRSPPVSAGRAVVEVSTFASGNTLPPLTMMADGVTGRTVTVTQNVLVDSTVVVGSAA